MKFVKKIFINLLGAFMFVFQVYAEIPDVAQECRNVMLKYDECQWVEIAKYNGYSLILRKEALNDRCIYCYTDTYRGYRESLPKTIVDRWFNEFPENSDIKRYTVGNTALMNLGCYRSTEHPYYSKVYACNTHDESIGTGYSLPNPNLPKGAFLLSYQEVESYIHNFAKKIGHIPCSWLRSSGEGVATGLYFGDMMCGNHVGVAPLNQTFGIIPALWVRSSLFGDEEPTIQQQSVAFLEGSSPEEILTTFNDMVGIDNFKTELEEIIIQIRQNQRDAMRGRLGPVRPSYHMLLMGNPGTGKTTIARKMADLFYKAGIISENKFKQVERKDLVDQYIGGTEAKVERILREAEGGVLFIDEAYSLVGEGRDVGRHVIEGILSSMTDNRCIIIAAGYPHKMQEFLDMNPGLDRRFTYHITLRDYSEKELFEIFKNLVSRNGLEIQNDEKSEIENIFSRYFQSQKLQKGSDFGNAGSVNNFFESVKRKRAMRLHHQPNVQEDFITLQDVSEAINNH